MILIFRRPGGVSLSLCVCVCVSLSLSFSLSLSVRSMCACVYACVRARACVWWNFAACKFQKKLKYTIQGPQLAIFQEVTFTSSMF